jgi:hypothetical protein
MGSRRRSFVTTGALLGVAGLVVGLIPASAATPAAVPTLAKSTQFDITGIIQAATLDGAAAQWALPNNGGTVTVNGQVVVIPKETVVILPANALTWQELFSHAPAPYGIPGNLGVTAAAPQSGLALLDNAAPSTRVSTYEAHVVGNRVIDPVNVNGCSSAALGWDPASSTCDRYIAGLVNVSQQSLNSGAGHINFIDYANGVMYVGGTVMPDASLSPTNPGTRVAINDPAPAGGTGRYSSGSPVGLVQDARFQVDQDNPTIVAETGFPMCLPRTLTPDPLCPESNRPVVTARGDESGITPNPNALVFGQHYTLFRMDSPANVDSATPLSNFCLRTPCADPRQQAPFEIGDYVTFAGTLGVDLAGQQFVSAHTIVASLGIYTQPGIDPAYNTVDVSLIGTGGLTVFGAGEAAIRTRFEGMTTDESRPVAVYGIDIDPLTGLTSDRSWGAAMPDAGPPTGAVRGRWRFRPPCTDTTATMLASPGKGCTPPPAGQFIPPTREVRGVVMNVVPGATPTLTPANTIASGLTAANGISYGQYHAPIQEYIFPENVPGTPIPENNFNTIPFLALGGYSSSTGVRAKVLTPWPSNVLPAASVCAVANAGGSYSVKSGAVGFLLSGSAGANPTGTISYSWTIAPTGAAAPGSLVAPTTAQTVGYNAPTPNPVLTTPVATVTLTVFQTAPGCPLTSTATAPITITANTFAPVVTSFSTNRGSNPTINTTTVTPGQGLFNLTAQGTFTNSVATVGTTTFIGHFQFVQTAGPAVTLFNGGRVNVQCQINGRPAGSTCNFGTVPMPVIVPAGYLATTSYLGQAKFSVNLVLDSVTGSTATSQLRSAGPAFPTPQTVTAQPSVPATITLLPTKDRQGQGRLSITATFAGPTTTVIKLLPYVTDAGTVYDPGSGLGNTFTWDPATATFLISIVGAPSPACNPGGAFATPCSAKPLIVEATAAGAPNTIIASSVLTGTALSVIK